MMANDVGEEIVSSLVRAFPDLTSYFKEWVERQGYEDGEFPPHSVLERFADATTAAITVKNEKLAKTYLAFIESYLGKGDDEVRRLIDVLYCENLMWDIQDVELKRWGWSILPTHVRQLYTDEWGEPHLTHHSSGTPNGAP